jgi:hypothetical protein
MLHASHIPALGQHEHGNGTRDWHIAHAAHLDVKPGLTGPGDHGGVDCPSPEWVAQRDRLIDGDALLASAPILPTPSVALSISAPIPYADLPIPRGPDLQALLQRFTL